MKNLVCLSMILAMTSIVGAQKTFEVQDFSEDYYGKVFLENPTEVFSKGWVAIYQKKTNKQLIKVDAEELIGDTEEGKIKTNVKELPYGEQSVIIYEDFNFDSIKDFAIMDGQNSCYHGPSFQVYLGGKVKGKFTLNQEFTRLSQEYCGMFQVDAKEKKLSTMTKSGCCWHQYSEFIVVNNKPKAVKIVEEDAMGFPFITTSTEIWDGKKMIETSVRSIDFAESESKILLSFKTKSGENEIVLFSTEDQLNYIFVNKNGNIDFAYPKDSEIEEPTFTLDSKQNPTTLTFTNNGVTYKIYETEGEKIGVQVNAKGKISEFSGDLSSKKGSLNSLSGENLTNITFNK